MGSIAQGNSATQTWTVTAPAGDGHADARLSRPQPPTSAMPRARPKASPPNSKLPRPRHCPRPSSPACQPTSGGVGTVETITGKNFGATATAPSDVLLFVPGISWGAPYDGATLDIISWSPTSIQFALPAPSGPGGEYHISPPGPLYIVIGTPSATSNAETIAIGSSVSTPPNAPVITGVNPTSGSASAGTAITLTGQNFGASEATCGGCTFWISDYVTLTDSGGTTFSVPGEGSGLTVTNWSPTSITFDVPSGAATGTATVNVTVNNFTSNSEPLTISP